MKITTYVSSSCSQGAWPLNAWLTKASNVRFFEPPSSEYPLNYNFEVISSPIPGLSRSVQVPSKGFRWIEMMLLAIFEVGKTHWFSCTWNMIRSCSYRWSDRISNNTQSTGSKLVLNCPREWNDDTETNLPYKEQLARCHYYMCSIEMVNIITSWLQLIILTDRSDNARSTILSAIIQSVYSPLRKLAINDGEFAACSIVNVILLLRAPVSLNLSLQLAIIVLICIRFNWLCACYYFVLKASKFWENIRVRLQRVLHSCLSARMILHLREASTFPIIDVPPRLCTISYFAGGDQVSIEEVDNLEFAIWRLWGSFCALCTVHAYQGTMFDFQDRQQWFPYRVYRRLANASWYYSKGTRLR